MKEVVVENVNDEKKMPEKRVSDVGGADVDNSVSPDDGNQGL